MKVTQLCLTLYDPMNCNPPASSMHKILQGTYNSVCGKSHFSLYDPISDYVGFYHILNYIWSD